MNEKDIKKQPGNCTGMQFNLRRVTENCCRVNNRLYSAMEGQGSSAVWIRKSNERQPNVIKDKG